MASPSFLLLHWSRGVQLCYEKDFKVIVFPAFSNSLHKFYYRAHAGLMYPCDKCFEYVIILQVSLFIN